MNVNNKETQISVLEAAVSDLTISDIVEDHNPDCFVVVYAVDDLHSFGKNVAWPLVIHLKHLKDV